MSGECDGFSTLNIACFIASVGTEMGFDHERDRLKPGIEGRGITTSAGILTKPPGSSWHRVLRDGKDIVGEGLDSARGTWFGLLDADAPIPHHAAA